MKLNLPSVCMALVLPNIGLAEVISFETSGGSAVLRAANDADAVWECEAPFSPAVLMFRPEFYYFEASSTFFGLESPAGGVQVLRGGVNASSSEVLVKVYRTLIEVTDDDANAISTVESLSGTSSFEVYEPLQLEIDFSACVLENFIDVVDGKVSISGELGENDVAFSGLFSDLNTARTFYLDLHYVPGLLSVNSDGAWGYGSHRDFKTNLNYLRWLDEDDSPANSIGPIGVRLSFEGMLETDRLGPGIETSFRINLGADLIDER